MTFDQYHYVGVDENSAALDLWTRAFMHPEGGSSFPGPTLKIRRGDTVTVNFVNALGPNEDNPDFVHTHNDFTDPNTTNFHTHGLHISGNDPEDNVFVAVPPAGTEGSHTDAGVAVQYGASTGQTTGTHKYVYQIPEDHAPGIHWYHPHHHGSTALHVGAGASGMILV